MSTATTVAEEPSDLWDWGLLLLPPLPGLIALILVYSHLWPNHAGWDFNQDGVVTITDVKLWAGSLTRYPAHQAIIDLLPRPARFLEMTGKPVNGRTIYWGFVDWIAIFWIGGGTVANWVSEGKRDAKQRLYLKAQASKAQDG